MSTSIETLKAIFDLSEVAVVVTNKAGVVCYLNASFERLTGHGTDDLEGRSIDDVGGMTEAQRGALWKRLQTGRSWAGEFPMRHKDGRWLQIAASISPVLEADGSNELFVGLNRPVHEAEGLKALTRRELDVLELLAAGLNNREIAEQLGLSHRTVGHHVGSILRKLDAPNRVVAATRMTMAQNE